MIYMEKFKLPEKTAIAIQGPTKYYKEISAFYKNFEAPIVYTTWKNEPAQNILYLERSGIHMELIDTPEYNGYLNVNMQNASSTHGLKYIKQNYDINHVLKIRSDTTIIGLERLWPNIYGCEISWAHIYNPIEDPYWAYNLNGKVHTGMDWISDYAVFGKIDNLINMFDWYIPFNLPVPPESLYMYRYLLMKKLEHNFDVNYLKENGVIFFGKYFNETNSDMYCMKYNQSFRHLMNTQPKLRLS